MINVPKTDEITSGSITWFQQKNGKTVLHLSALRIQTRSIYKHGRYDSSSTEEPAKCFFMNWGFLFGHRF
jgi:hypothetical protein